MQFDAQGVGLSFDREPRAGLELKRALKLSLPLDSLLSRAPQQTSEVPTFTLELGQVPPHPSDIGLGPGGAQPASQLHHALLEVPSIGFDALELLKQSPISPGQALELVGLGGCSLFVAGAQLRELTLEERDSALSRLQSIAISHVLLPCYFETGRVTSRLAELPRDWTSCLETGRVASRLAKPGWIRPGLPEGWFRSMDSNHDSRFQRPLS